MLSCPSTRRRQNGHTNSLVAHSAQKDAWPQGLSATRCLTGCSKQTVHSLVLLSTALAIETVSQASAVDRTALVAAPPLRDRICGDDLLKSNCGKAADALRDCCCRSLCTCSSLGLFLLEFPRKPLLARWGRNQSRLRITGNTTSHMIWSPLWMLIASIQVTRDPANCLDEEHSNNEQITAATLPVLLSSKRTLEARNTRSTNFAQRQRSPKVSPSKSRTYEVRSSDVVCRDWHNLLKASEPEASTPNHRMRTPPQMSVNCCASCHIELTK